MKNIRITYQPKWVQNVLVVLLFIITLAVAAASAAFDSDKVFVVSMLAIVIILSITYIVTNICTDVSYGIDNKIYCKWAFYKWSIDLEAISEVYYAVEPTGSETRTIHNLSIIFIDQSNAKKKLYSKVLAGDVAKCIAGQSDELPLMELYRFAESRYPEKAKGYYDGGRK